MNNFIKGKGGVEKMDSRKKLREEFFEPCVICGKEIIGTSPESVINNIKVHIMTQHPSKEQNE